MTNVVDRVFKVYVVASGPYYNLLLYIATTIPTGRCIADASFNSGIYGGLGPIFLSAETLVTPKIMGAGGTSAGTAFWAVLTAIASQYGRHSIGYINPQLYQNRNLFYAAEVFHDITKR